MKQTPLQIDRTGLTWSLTLTWATFWDFSAFDLSPAIPA